MAAEPAVTVAFAPVKGDRPEWVVQKLTELGVDRIVPITTRRSVVSWEGDRATRVAGEAFPGGPGGASQSRRTRLPEIGPVSSLAGLAAETGAPRRWPTRGASSVPRSPGHRHRARGGLGRG